MRTPHTPRTSPPPFPLEPDSSWRELFWRSDRAGEGGQCTARRRGLGFRPACTTPLVGGVAASVSADTVGVHAKARELDTTSGWHSPSPPSPCSCYPATACLRKAFCGGERGTGRLRSGDRTTPHVHARMRCTLSTRDRSATQRPVGPILQISVQGLSDGRNGVLKQSRLQLPPVLDKGGKLPPQ